jgi:hypothetical protein
MLTAATAALLSGHAEAGTCDGTSTPGNCNISTAVTAPVYTGAPTSGVTGATGNFGNITIATNGSIVIGTSPPTAPALTINGPASGPNTTPVLVTNNTTISYTGISYAVGTLLQEASVPTSSTTNGIPENWVGELVNSSSGIINLTGAGTNKNGILIAGGAFPGSGAVTNASTGIYATQNLGVFTGITAAGTTEPVAINLATGSTLEVQGTSSFGINLASALVTAGVPSGGASLIGDINVGGSILMTPTTVGSTTPTGNVAVNLAGYLTGNNTPNPALTATTCAATTAACAGTTYAMVGSFNVTSGGTISSEGAGAEGVVVLGGMNGAVTNLGQISTFGTTTPSTALNANDPEAGSALVIANNVTGGIFNGGPTSGGVAASATRATISAIGTTETIDIASAFNPVPVPITIGGYTDTAGYKFSLLSRGTISASAEDANLSATDILVVGQNQAAINLPFGIFNSGVMTANAVTNSAGPTSFTTVTATTIDIGNFVTVGTQGVLGTTALPGGVSYALVNANETGSGTIQASVAGAQTGTAIAIHIEAAKAASTAGSLPSIFNSGIISATATTTNLDSTGLAAFAILDESGTLTTVYNTGTISAAATQLNNSAQRAVAIDVAATAAPVTITDISPGGSADIIGDIIFGTNSGTLNVTGLSGFPALVSGNLVFNNATATSDNLNVGQFATVSGQIFEQNSGSLNISIAQTGTLDFLTSQPTNLNSNISQAATPNKPLAVNTLTVAQGGLLNISLSQGNNAAAFPTKNVTVINAQSANIGGDGITGTIGLTFGGFVGTPSATGAASQFVLISTPSGALTISPQELTLLTNTFDSSNSGPNSKNGVPFLFTSDICTIGVAAATGNQVCASAPNNASSVAGTSELVLTLTPKPATGPGGLGLTGFAAKMFPFANQALVNDNTLGAAMVNSIVDQPTAQAAYAAFAPDVSGATRATAISLTDSATNVVAARQRALRMYANQEGDTTLWGQQFVQRLSQNNSALLTGYNDSGFGFVLGADQGDAADGRYGAAFTFFTGGMSQKEPTSAKTSSEYFELTGYTDWRGKGFFLDTQATAGYGNLKGRRFIRLTDPTNNNTVSREAQGNRATEYLAGSVTSGVVLTAGGTVITPQVDLDGLTGREEAYTESGGGQGFDLHVQPYYMNSLRAFIGTDLRQDFNFGDFYLQPELRFGYRYDFLDGAVKLNANFASVNSSNGQVYNPFSITGPDPDRGNLVLGGGVATTTGAWSIGLNYDYVRGSSGVGQQSGVLTLVGRI